MGTTARELIEEFAGGIRDGRRLKAWTPGGSSTPYLTPDHLDTPMDFDSVMAAGSLLGTKAMIVLDETDCIVDATLRFTQFYAHESCGKCTPCREGTWWMSRVLNRVEHGQGRSTDIDLMKDVGQKILFKAFCALADGAVSPIDSSIKFFREEYEEHVRLGRCPLKDAGPSLESASDRTGGTTGTTAQTLPEGIEFDTPSATGRRLDVSEVLG
jgi:NADH-quinone oxidoreductase subunit F